MLVFLNTQNSVLKASDAKDMTTSPWIYYEIAFSQSVRKTEPKSHRSGIYKFGAITESLNFAGIKYPVLSGHLEKINKDNLLEWERRYRMIDNYRYTRNALDLLYELKPLQE